MNTLGKIASVETKVLIHDEPKNWRQCYLRIQKYRSNNQAPVDTIGCGELGKGKEKIKRFQTLIALMLSPQTRDEMTARAVTQLREYTKVNFEQDLQLQSITEIKIGDLEECINCVGFYKTKSRHIKRMADLLNESESKDVPDSFEELVKLPGVGPKIAYLCLQYAWNKIDGIGVDVHVHRISNRLGWVESKNPEGTRKQLESFLPKEHWMDVNTILVGFGQILCNARNPNCGECPVNDICPSANLKKAALIIKSKKISKK